MIGCGVFAALNSLRDPPFDPPSAIAAGSPGTSSIFCDSAPMAR